MNLSRPIHSPPLRSRVASLPKAPTPSRDKLTKVGGSWSSDRDLIDYSATFRSASAAAGQALGKFTALGAAALVGSTVAGILAAGPLGMAGLCAGTYFAGRKIKSKIGAANGAASRLGEKVGASIGKWAHKKGIPLKDGMVQLAKGELTRDSVAQKGKVEEAKIGDFVSKLQPGDIILTRAETSAPVNIATTLLNGKSDFTHALLYEGDHQIIEAVVKGVVNRPVDEVLSSKNHAVALRPPYREGQEKAVLAFARQKVGRPYDKKFRLDNDSYYCSELVYQAMEDGAPQIDVKTRSVLGRDFVIPDDIYETPGSTLVAEIGEHRSLLDRTAAKIMSAVSLE